VAPPVLPWHAQLAVFDLETTGVDVATSRVVTAHVGVLDAAGAVVEQWEWLADPGVEIPEGATAVHGVSTEHARAHGRPARQVVGEIVHVLDVLISSGLPLVIYNAAYDLSLLHHEARRHRVPVLADPRPVIDPFVIDKHVDRYRRGKRTLTATSAVYGVELLDAHSAGADAVAAGRVAQALAARYDGVLAELTAHDLHDRQERWCAAQAASFQDYLRRERDPEAVVDGSWPMRSAPVEVLGARHAAGTTKRPAEASRSAA